MRILFLVWLVIEVLQLVLIGMLVVGYRNLQRRMDEGALSLQHSSAAFCDGRVTAYPTFLALQVACVSVDLASDLSVL